jgi:hypothetical protein
MPGKGKPFQKGNKLAKGRPPVSEDEKVLRKLSKAEFAEIASVILRGDRAELERMAKDPKTTIVKAMAASVCATIIKKGDADALDKFFNRIIGKVKDEVEVSGDGLKPQVILNFEDNGRKVKPL